MLRFDKITKIFGANTAVQSASFTVEQPMMIGIIGRSGAGKSTLLRVLNRLTDASTGEITFDGTPGQLTTGVARDIYGADASFSESATSTQIETTQVGKTMLADCAAQ